VFALQLNRSASLTPHIPHRFGKSYTVPVLKSRSSIHSKTITVDDFRGICISPVVSKVLDTVYFSGMRDSLLDLPVIIGLASRKVQVVRMLFTRFVV